MKNQTASKTFSEIMKDPAGYADSLRDSSEVLTRLLYQTIAGLGIRENTMMKFIDRYVKQSALLGNESKRGLGSIKGNLIKQLSQKTITVRLFLKAMRIIKAESVDFRVTIYRDSINENHRQFESRVLIAISQESDLNDKNKESDLDDTQAIGNALDVLMDGIDRVREGALDGLGDGSDKEAIKRIIDNCISSLQDVTKGKEVK